MILEKMLSLMEVMGALGGISFAIFTFALPEEAKKALREVLLRVGIITIVLFLAGTLLMAISLLIQPSEWAFRVSVVLLTIGAFALAIASLRVFYELSLV